MIERRYKHPHKCSLPSFLVVDTQLYRSLCPSVRPSVRRSIEVIESKSVIMSILDTFMYVCVWSGVWSVHGGWMPLPGRPQRYCDLASLVSLSLEPRSLILGDAVSGLDVP